MVKAFSYKSFVLLVAVLSAVAFGLSPEASGGCVQVSIVPEGEITVRFTLPKKLAAPPWDLDALADQGFSLEKHGRFPYFPVRPVTFRIDSAALSLKLLEAKRSDASDVVRQAEAAPQPRIESDILVAPGSRRPIPLVVFPEACFPREHVVVESPVTFGTKTVARAKIYPFVCDDEHSAPTRADEIVFRVRALHVATGKESPAAGSRSPPPGKTAGAAALILTVSAAGVYSVPVEDLFPWWGEPPFSLNTLGLTCRGHDVAYTTTGDGDPMLEAGESILFYAVGGDNIFTPENAYWLSQEGTAVAMPSVSRPPPQEGSVTHLPRRVRFQQNHMMYEGHPPGAGDDHWFWTKLTAPHKEDVEVDIHNLADSPGFQAVLRVALQGATSSHKTCLFLNGDLLVEGYWDGVVPKVLEAEMSQHLLHEGTNVVSIEEISRDENPDIVYLDWIELYYDSNLVAGEGQTALTVPPNVPGIIVSGIGDPELLVLDVTEERTPCLIEDGAVTPLNGDYRLEFGTMSGSEKRYVIVPAGSTRRPDSIRQRSSSTWSNPDNRADWIAIAPADFMNGATTLASHRESQGLRTAVVNIQDIYDEFNYAVASPEAIRTFVSFAYNNWNSPAPKYLLLFGDGHGDYMDWSQASQPNYLLPHYSWVPPLGWAPDDDWFGCVEGEDAFPEVFVGRLPVQSAAQATSLVEKTMAYDSVAVPQEWQERAAFCASEGGTFQGACHFIAEGLAPTFERLMLFRDDYDAAEELKADILKTFEAGTSFFFYVGHGNIERWSEYVLHVSDVPSLTNSDKLPVMCMLTCLSGYFAVPWKNCLAEDLVTASNGGAIGCIGPTALGYPSEHMIFGQEVVRWLSTGATVGQCSGEAKLRSYARGLSESFLKGFSLLGDPATAPRFAVPTPDLLWFQ